MSTAFLPYGRQAIDDADVAAVVEILRGPALTTGPAVPAFEDALAQTVGARYAVACSSGTAALHLAALALELGPGDVVIVPTITFLATANAARYVGADVVFSDVDPDTGLMAPAHLEAALADAAGRARAVFPVHLAGQAADTAALSVVDGADSLAMVEDACHALGTRAERNEGEGEAAETVGEARHSAMCTFSFHPVKTVTTGEGGAITTNNLTLADRLRALRNHGMVRSPKEFEDRERAFDHAGRANPWYYEMPEVGFNYRASDIHCALGRSQLGKLEQFVERRRALVERYDAALAPLAPLVRPLGRAPDCRPGWYLYVTLIDFAAAGRTRDDVMRKMRDAGIGTQVHYIPVHRQPYYRRTYGEQHLPGAERYYERCLSLPLFPAMNDADVDRVVDALATALRIGNG